jgi:sterol-4alpha-carboxylate 3-dehydrogenase (decarboxylating)
MYQTTSDSVLIVGGTGFIGSHLTSHFVSNKSFASVTVLSRHASTHKTHVRGATYLDGDITSADSLRRAIASAKPSVIIHAASPSPATGTSTDYKSVNIRGTGNLLRVARDSEHVKALIYTSSSTLAAGHQHIDLTEEHPLANEDPAASAYTRSKAVADLRVLGANTPKPEHVESWSGSLLTACLRLPILHGTHDVTGSLDGQWVLGDGNNMWSICSIPNMATAHHLLASALLNPSPRPEHMECHGEAFNINDGEPLLYHSLQGKVATIQGFDSSPATEPSHIPASIAILLAVVLEWVYFLFTLGVERPSTFSRRNVEYACYTHTYNIEKARMRLGYKPRGSNGSWEKLGGIEMY